MFLTTDLHHKWEAEDHCQDLRHEWSLHHSARPKAQCLAASKDLYQARERDW